MKRSASFVTRFAAASAVWAMLAPALVLRADSLPSGKGLTEEQKILHVLGRLGFGARPGDVEKVKAIGLQKYIERQLDPAKIDDPVADAKVKDLDVFNLSTAELFAKYPNPGALLKQLEGGKVAQANAKAQKAEANNAQAQPKDADQLTQEEQRERRQKIQELYAKYDLKPAAQILPSIVANRVLRDVYSERQLQEVMVDFWQNHFNVFAGKAAVRWYIPSYERDVLRPNALGNFRDLLVGTAKHPAMLFYLDNFENVSPDSGQPGRGNGNGKQAQRLQALIRNGGQITPEMRERIKQQTGATDAQLDQRMQQVKADPQAQPQQQRAKRGLNENYARELMELHTLGVDNGYTQKDIIEVAKCFTGWTIADPRGYRRAAAATIEGTEDKRMTRLQRQAGVPDDIDSGEFYFNARTHGGGAKTVM
ncbi:MAG TPA: DUF1800 family protein, partial [Pyrinomonadaceae bacterium]|nr:DUF1800 family protein [Pyrinomonadaceae bacterium]